MVALLKEEDAVGSMILEIDNQQITGIFYKDNGDVFDKFRIIKQDSIVLSGIKHNSNIQELKVYPNPFSNAIVVEFDAKEMKPTSITIQNLIGQLMVETLWNGKSNMGNNKIEIQHLQDLPSGEYVISIKQNDDVVSQKLIKIK